MTPEQLDVLTPAQAEAMQAVEQYGSIGKAAKALGRDERGLRRIVKRAKDELSKKGFAPGHWNSGTAHGYSMGKVTVHRLANGNVVQAWERQHPDQEKFDEFVAATLETVPKYDCPDPPKDRKSDIIPWVQIGDAHLGMLAHEAETGANFDLKIAERELCEAISLLIEETGEHDRCVINDLGDFTHYENMKGETEASGHRLDYDGRFPKMISVYKRVMDFIVERALEKFNKVDVIINQGNHSRTNDIWMRHYIEGRYGHTGRVTALDNSNVFIAYRMGKTLVMTHHSDKCKPDKLANVMAEDYSQDWGETEYRYIDIGHIHHKMTSKEHPGVMIESFNILANRDLYAHDNGYRSRQSITVIDRSRQYGEVARRILPIQRVRDRIHENCKKKGVKAPPATHRRRAYAA